MWKHDCSYLLSWFSTVLIRGMTDGLLTIDINASSSFESVDEQVYDLYGCYKYILNGIVFAGHR